jgi:hypothetical protein
MATFTITGTKAVNSAISVTVADAAIVGAGKYELQWASREKPSLVLLDSSPDVGTGTLTGTIFFTGEVAELRPCILAAGMLYVWDLTSSAKNVMLGYTECPVVQDNPAPDEV